MQLKNQCCTAEQGKRLAELGITEQATHYHRLCKVNGVESYEVLPAMIYHYGEWQENEDVFRCMRKEVNNDFAPAFTVAELGVMLPPEYTTHKHSEQSNTPGCFWCVQYDYDNECEVCVECRSTPHNNTFAKTEAESRAAMLIRLLENNHITASECNERLKSA